MWVIVIPGEDMNAVLFCFVICHFEVLKLVVSLGLGIALAFLLAFLLSFAPLVSINVKINDSLHLCCPIYLITNDEELWLASISAPPSTLVISTENDSSNSASSSANNSNTISPFLLSPSIMAEPDVGSISGAFSFNGPITLQNT